MASARGGDDGALVEVVPVEDDGRVPVSWAVAPGPDGAGDGTVPQRPAGRRRTLGLVLVVGLVLTAAVAQAVEHRRDASRAAARAAIEGTVPLITGPLEPVWHEDPWYSTFHEVDDLVVLSRSGGRVRAVEAATGAERWALDEPVLGCWPSATSGRVDVGDTGERVTDALLCRGRSPGTGSPDVMARLLLVSGATGEVLAERIVGTPAYAPALVGHDVVLVRVEADGVGVVRRGMVDGVVRWRAELPASAAAGRGGGRVAVRNGLVVLSGPVTAVLDADDGAVLGAWTARASAGGGRAPDPAYVRVLRDGYGVHRAGEPHGTWHDLEGSPVGRLPGVPVEPMVTDGSDDGVLLVASADLGELAALDEGAARELWRVPFGAGRVPVVRDAQVVVLTASSAVAVDVRTGRERWRQEVPDVLPHAGVVTDGRVLVVVVARGRTAELLALDLDDGSVRWRSPTPAVPGREGDAPVHDMAWVWLGTLAGRPVLLNEDGMTALG